MNSFNEKVMTILPAPRTRNVDYYTMNLYGEREFSPGAPQLPMGTHLRANHLYSGPKPQVPPRSAPCNASRLYPIYPYRYDIIEGIARSGACIIKGSPGSGKSTQIPQYIMEAAAMLNQPIRILSVVPQRIQAISISSKIARERGELLGTTVGYQAQLESSVSPVSTLLTICSSDTLLRTVASGDVGIFGTITHLIVDELQEQDHFTDLLLWYLRCVLPSYPSLNFILIISSQLNEQIEDLYTSYFFRERNFKILNIEKIKMPLVNAMFLEDAYRYAQYTAGPFQPVSYEYEEFIHRMGGGNIGGAFNSFETIDLELILRLIQKLQQLDKQASILVFLPGYEEIAAIRWYILHGTKYRFEERSFDLHIFHKDMASGDLNFNSLESQKRKIILATGLAESSMTCQVRFVIDCGRIRDSKYNYANVTYELNWISKKSADERARTLDGGYCFRLYTREAYGEMSRNDYREICKVPLDLFCLYIRSIDHMNMSSIQETFNQLIQPPPEEKVCDAITNLIRMKALDYFQSITRIGENLLEFPIEPRFSYVLLKAIQLQCLDPVLTIISWYSHNPSRLLPSIQLIGRQPQLTTEAQSFMDLLNNFHRWEVSAAPASTSNHTNALSPGREISAATFEQIFLIRNYLLGHLRASGFVSVTKGPGDLKDLNMNSGDYEKLTSALTATVLGRLKVVNESKII